MAVTRNAFGGDLAQSINPMTWWLTAPLTQLGFINVNNGQTSDPDMELSIVNNVASYGRQLGRMLEALEVLARNVQIKPSPEDLKAIKDFQELAAAIKAVKSQQEPSPGELLDRFLAGFDGEPKLLQRLAHEVNKRLALTAEAAHSEK